MKDKRPIRNRRKVLNEWRKRQERLTMSADNFYAVIYNPNTGKYIVSHGFMSPLADEGIKYVYELAEKEGSIICNSRADALVVAHDLLLKDEVVEYGVIELALPELRRVLEYHSYEGPELD